MVSSSMHLKEIVSSSIALLDIIKNIVEHYLSDNAEDALYDVHELPRLVDFLIKENASTILATFKTPSATYSGPLPIRPEISSFTHARFEYAKTLKKYTTINQDDILQKAEYFFMNVLVNAIKNNSIDLGMLKNTDMIDDFFEELKAVFRVALIQQIKTLSLTIKPEEISTPAPVSATSPIEKLVDDESDSDVEDVYCTELATPTDRYRSSSLSPHHGLFTPFMNGKITGSKAQNQSNGDVHGNNEMLPDLA